MAQPMNVIWTIDQVHTSQYRILDCGPGVGLLNKVDTIY